MKSIDGIAKAACSWERVYSLQAGDTLWERRWQIGIASLQQNVIRLQWLLLN
jgi:hypothetical protein